ncbi:hypothetical protein [Luteimonas kalidii]|uniref:Uncharacterized protein n=1 Tax=Luteimonas kalidii TaxID=3042025 RepID=A0ABT6JUV4_9GAMM|nr:hypothetical protein [Luteimonas kalidii]MDH5834472.1 hypothetical protein [Luteimonas kalidii]
MGDAGGAQERTQRDPDDGMAAAVEAEKDELLQQFFELLGEDPSLDLEAREQIRKELTAALDAVEAVDPMFEAPDRQVWMDAAKALQTAGAVSDEDANALVRQLDGALAAFERKESKFALEFSQRMARDGEDAALEWLRQNREALLGDGSADAAQAAMSIGIGEPAPVVATDATRSRARRVRGPPPRSGR